ncbi:MAG: acyl-CoA dehydrogenase [Acidimicrobiaceae bacterium]|jgi:(2S)-methylsuccinyl-CoA dehydrogenase|nr:acyl-CoA dehydrogenase [Acidimicrobiaceae bacterium]|tara:strand:- start:7987 stop:9555 length:1569 start_codon:yes stop_codon:yes gene_type:complete
MGIIDLENSLRSAEKIIDQGLNYLRKQDNPEQNQVFLYELAHARSALSIAQGFKDFAEKGDNEKLLVQLFCADTFKSLSTMCFGRERLWGIEDKDIQHLNDYVALYGSPDHYSSAVDLPLQSHLSEELELVAETFRRFGKENIEEHAERVHREDLDVPESIIVGLSELGCFGLSIPEVYGGTATGTSFDSYGMVIATEELSKASLSIGGSLITRPEILARAIENGGTEDQKERLLPLIASGQCMSAVAVTEPDFGSDVASIKTTAKQLPDGDWELNGVKTWCTFAGRADLLMVLARTNPDISIGHRGLSIFVVEKERAEGHSFSFHQDHGGKLEGRSIPTLGYRGMHSFEVSFQNWKVPSRSLVGGESGKGKGFYLQMAGFENGRLQTAARAVGVMQRAYEEAVAYSQERKVFGLALADYELTQSKLGRMSALIQACRQYTYRVGELMSIGEGTLEAAMVKAYACKAAEWVTREAMQIHGGFGYAEEYVVSRLYVDARVLSIFEGADETLCLKLIGRRILNP